MQRSELIDLIQESIKMEDAVIPLYAQHISSTLFLSEFDAATRKSIVAALDRLGSDSTRHRSKLEALLQSVNESSQNVY